MSNWSPLSNWLYGRPFLAVDAKGNMGVHIVDNATVQQGMNVMQHIDTLEAVAEYMGPRAETCEMSMKCLNGTPIWNMVMPIRWLEDTEENRKTVKLLYG